MPGRLITQQSEFDALCDELEHSGLVAFDTEFVSECYYRPKLCLLQFATADRIAAVDPFEVKDLSRWWSLMTDDRTTVVVHGGREEVRFCLHQAGQPPRRLVDVQVAEGLLSRGFPLGYSTLVARVTGHGVHGAETRTDWRRRPLTHEQIDYALEDVRHLLDVWSLQQKSLESRGRLTWADAEFARLVEEVQGESRRESWRRLSGAQKLSRRQLAVLRALHAWRESQAEKTDRPVRNVIRDDLLLDIARRQPKTARDLDRTRDMQRRDYRDLIPALLAAVRAGLEAPDNDLPAKRDRPHYPAHDEVLGRVLAIALAHRCAEFNVSLTLVGTAADLQDLVHWHVFDGGTGPPPRLLQTWRADVCGNLLTDLLDGKLALRISNPRSDAPLEFDRIDGPPMAVHSDPPAAVTPETL